MNEISQLGPPSQYTDNTLVEIAGPDNTVFGFQYDQQTRSFFTREVSLVFSGKHGITHITTDPIPSATCSTPGLLSADDKCRLDNLVGTRIGVLGFQGSGFPDDGGYLQGDIILAAGSEMISLERVGNVVRFVVDVPAVFTCGNETCVQMYWLQDETDIAAIRPPIASGKLLGANLYGALKVYVFPDNTIVNPANPTSTLNNKGFYPSFIFQPYDDGTGVNEAELDIVLQRNASGVATIGMGFTPGANGTPQHVVFMGVDDSGNRLTYQLMPEAVEGVLGTLQYNGVTITTRKAIITSYDPTVLSSNVYNAQWWDPQAKSVNGTAFLVTNQANFDQTTNQPVLDSTNNALLAIGQIVDVQSVQVGTANGNPTYVHYCQAQPTVNVGSLWTTIGAIQFGDTLTSMDGATTSATVNDVRTYDKTWGIDALHNTVLFNSGSPVTLNTAYNALVDQSIPALTITEAAGSSSEHRRPVTIWNRNSVRDCFMELHFARPVAGGSDGTMTITYPPIDILLRAPIDSFDVKYGVVGTTGTVGSGTYSGKTYAVVPGLKYDEIPSRGLIRVAGVTDYNNAFGYIAVMANNSDRSAVLIFSGSGPTTGDAIEVMHEDYATPAARLQWTFNNTHDLTMQAQVGTLNPATSYSGSSSSANLAGAFVPGYAVGTTCWQDGAVVSGTTGYTSSPSGFVTYNGSIVSGSEVFNVLQVLVTDGQCWLWWNGLLLAPSPSESGSLGTPVDISTPYFPISDVVEFGKVGVRLFPGAKLRRFIVRSKPTSFSQYTLGQLEVGNT